MMWFGIMQILSTVIECLWLGRKIDREKDLEILLLRRQLDIVGRARVKRLRVSRTEKLILAVLAAQLKVVTGWPVKQFGRVLRIFQSETVFKWHRKLVRRKWSYQSHRQRGRPAPTRKLNGSLCDWPAKIETGATTRLRGNSPNWASRLATKQSPTF